MSKSAIRTELRLIATLAVLLGSTPSHAQRPNQGDDESAALVDEGRSALKKNKLDAAAKALDQAIALNPRRVDAYVLRSAVHAARKEYKQGVELMRRAQALAPADEEVLTALGSQLVLAGDTGEGVPLLVGVTAKNPSRYDAQLLLGHHYHDASKWPDAIAAFEAYFKARPKALSTEDSRHRIDLADSYLRFHQPTKARAQFEQAERELPKKVTRDGLRVRIGIAWATAAIDCKQARPLLEKLAPIAENHPEVWLVDGQCALALGNPAAALELGRRYLEKSQASSAAGHALVGEAYAARGNLTEAKKELEAARKLEPTRRRWPVRLAFVLRKVGDLAGSLDALEKTGAPDKPAIDPDWWTELGETLLAKGENQTVITRLTPVLPDLPQSAQLRAILGAAQLAANQPEAAIKSLGDAESIQSAPRSKKLLVDALTALAADKLKANDATGAEPLLVRADGIEGNAAVWRDLGIARLALNKPADAVAAFDKALRSDPTTITQMLAARARAQAGDATGARPLYDKALAGEKGDNAVEISLDWAASELAGGDPAIAVTALEKSAAFAKKDPLAARHKSALATARHAAGLAALRAGNGQRAMDLLKAAAKDDNSLATRCDLAIAMVAAGDANAVNALKGVTGQACPFPPPADTQAAPILISFVEGIRDPRRASKSLDKLTALPSKSGPAAVLLGTSIRVVALEAARDAFNSGQYAAARRYLTQARSANARVGNDEVAHNLAAVDLAEGKVDLAIAQLEKLAGKLPEALVNLGIAYDKKGEPQKALDAWRRAKKAGSRYAPLNEWIESKERIYGP